LRDIPKPPMSLILPKLTKAKFFGYGPIFDTTIEVEIKNNLLILLGGNGLGKTTLLQSIIYAFGGPLDNKIEVFPEKRWTKKYFVDRFDKPDGAFVEIEFKLKNDTIRIKRGFQSDRLMNFSLNGKENNDFKSDAESSFETYLKSNCNYDSLTSFRFLIHKLCFLSESRENLVWDRDLQTRILMLIFSDSIAEDNFRIKNDQLQKIDSKIRHLRVDINKIQDKLTSFKNGKKKSPKGSQVNKVDKSETEISDVKNKYLKLIDSRLDLQRKDRQLTNELSILNSEIEDIQEKITQSEQQFIYKQITNFESQESRLAIHKLIHKKLCPACGTENQKLFEKAKEFLAKESCPLCGNSNETHIKNIAPGLEAEMSEKLKSKIIIESSLLETQNILNELLETESAMQFQLNKFMLETPQVVFVKDFYKATATKADLQKTLISLKKQQANYQINFEILKTDLEKEYDSFRQKNNQRITQLSNLYKDYASEFLGIPCDLIPVDNKKDFLDLKLFVPRFSDKTRNTPESCSEAQRFFLDIAFRMSLIEIACNLAQSSATFICETPESALDISFRNNVSDMFWLFIRKKYTVVLSSNIQPEGIAESLVFHIPKEKRPSTVLNFLKIGKLSKVQESQIGNLNKIVKKLLTQTAK
jgi:DNA repair exonuclease SbcCD ATPase subunit